MFTKEDFSRASDQIKAKITVPILWARFYGASPQKWQSCRCPWRRDKHPSFGVSEDGKKWIDRATSDSGDVFDFYVKATGCDRRSSFTDLLAMARGADGAGNINSGAILVAPEEKTKERYHPVLRIPSAEELATIGQLRSISVDGLKLAVTRGFLRTADLDLYGFRAFIVTDRTRRLYLGRKLSGGNWKGILPGGQASWPIGCIEAQSFPAIAICEGLPDFLSAFGHVFATGAEIRVAPVCVSSSAMSIAEDALPHFTGKRVRIFVHDDDAGRSAYRRWKAQLDRTAAKVDSFEFTRLFQTNGQRVKDLNDLCRIDYDCWEANRLEIEAIMAF